MPLYRIRNVLEVRGITAFWNLEAGLTRGPDQDQDRSQARIKSLQQELQKARQDITDKDRQLKRLKNSGHGNDSKHGRDKTASSSAREAG